MPSSETARLAVVCALTLTVSSSGGAQDTAPTRGDPVLLSSTFEHRLQSRVAGREFVLWVSLPSSYREGGAGDTVRYPVLYLLDGRQSVQLLQPMLSLTNRGRAADLILVGVGYPLDSRGLPSCGRVLCRDIDYTPPAFPRPDSIVDREAPTANGRGGGAAFLRVLKEEVIPFVERRYRTTTDRGLFGYSQGGLFVTFTLFEAPELFSRYAAVSPAMFQDVEGMLRRERAFRQRMPELRKSVYFSVGADESPYAIADTWRMIGALCDGMWNGSYRGVSLLAAIHPGADHRSPALFAGALQTLYPPDTLAAVRQPARLMTSTCTKD